MTHIDPAFSLPNLVRYQGYHLQVFSAGRAKLSLQSEGRSKLEYYTALPKRHREAYERQRTRSGHLAPDHFARVDALLAEISGSEVFRLYQKGSFNKTADNAHLVCTREVTCIWVILEGMVHEWHVHPFVLGNLLVGTGPKSGQESLFNEFMPVHEHDWQDAVFTEDHYRKGLRGELSHLNAAPKPQSTDDMRPIPKRELPQAKELPDYDVIEDGTIDEHPAWRDPAVIGPDPDPDLEDDFIEHSLSVFQSMVDQCDGTVPVAEKPVRPSASKRYPKPRTREQLWAEVIGSPQQ